MTERTDSPQRTVPGIGRDHAADAIDHLRDRLVALIDLELTLKHIHWNVVGPSFIGVHRLLDDFTATTRGLVDDLAERIRVLGGVPRGRPGDVVNGRHWDDYPLEVATAQSHLQALDDVYDGILLDFRRAIVHVAELDPVSEDLLISQTAALEQHQWFVRSHLMGATEDLDSAAARQVLTAPGR